MAAGGTSGRSIIEAKGKHGTKPPADPNALSSLVTADWARVARLFGAGTIDPELLKMLPKTPGADEETWDVLLQMLAVDELQALSTLSDRTGIPYEADPKLDESASHFYETIDPDLARTRLVAGVRTEGHADETVMIVATAQPMQPAVFSMLEDALDMPVRLLLAPRASVANLTNRGYEQRGDLVEEIVEELPLDESAMETAAGAIGPSNDLLAMARQGPVIRLVNMILFEALRRRSSDVHIHPMESRLAIRFRIDGMLVDAFSPPPSLAAAISSRLKVMTELDIANRHSPQDGQTTVRIGSRKIDIRLSVIPTIYGERIVLRLLDQSQTQLDLDALGMDASIQTELMSILDRPNGMILVTGPTGSGKTTTLYAALGRVDRSSRNVMTVEDPVEYRLDGISQMQVNPKRNVTFAAGLRALLRQDPDVILVGEVRDQETAQLAVQASLTGHLVLATLHTNDAPSAIPRLVDIGLEPYLITSSLLGVLAQRLLRKVCVTCKGTAQVGGSACDACFGTGYRGRLAVHELMQMNDRLRRLTADQADGITLYEEAVKTGFKPMSVDADRKIALGLTTKEEAYRMLHSE